MKYIYLKINSNDIIEDYIEIDNGDSYKDNSVITTGLTLYSYDGSKYTKSLRRVIKFGKDKISSFPGVEKVEE